MRRIYQAIQAIIVLAIARPANAAIDANAVDPESALRSLLEAVGSRNWALVVALVIMLVIWFVNKVLRNLIPPKILPWLALALGAASQTVASITTGKQWYLAVLEGIVIGAGAAGSYSAIGKHVLK